MHTVPKDPPDHPLVQERPYRRSDPSIECSSLRKYAITSVFMTIRLYIYYT